LQLSSGLLCQLFLLQSFSNLAIYNNDDSKRFYSGLEDLIKKAREVWTILLLRWRDKKKLTFFILHAGELANCITTQTLVKQCKEILTMGGSSNHGRHNHSL
jgi:hypothetical protein